MLPDASDGSQERPFISVESHAAPAATSRRRSQPRNYLERTEQRRLFWLVMPPAIVLIVLGAWIEQTYLKTPSPPSPAQVDTRLAGGARGNVDGSIADAVVIEPEPPPFTEPTEERGAPAAMLAEVRDDTVFREADSEAWFALWKTILATDPAELDRRAGPPVGFSELFGQPRSFRGKPVRMRGTLRRLQRVAAPPNALEIDRYWQGWLDPEGGPPSPVVVYFLELPDTIKPGMRIIEPIEVVGYFFKRWAYQATDTIRTAPLLMARQPVPLAPPAKPADTDITAVGLWTGGIIVMLGFVMWLRRRQPRRPRASSPVSMPGAMLLACICSLPSHADETLAPTTESPAAELTPATYLQRFHLAAEDRAKLGPASQWSADRLDTALKILARLTAAPASLLDQWSLDATPPDAVNTPETPVGDTDQLIRVIGRAVLVQDIPLTPEMRERHARPTVSLVRVRDHDGLTIDLLAEHVPQAWPRGKAIDEPADAVGILIARHASPLPAPAVESDQAVPKPPAMTIVSDRVAWRPGTALGALGMDYGLFDAVQDGRRLTANDADAFYSVLAAAGRTKPAGLEDASPAVDILDLIDPQVRWIETHRGSPVRIRGTARRAIRIAVEDPFRRQQLAADHYWEVYVFVPTPTAVQVNGRLQETYTVVCCVRELPAGMPTGERITEEVDVSAFALKRYRYPLATGSPEQSPQESPLLVGQTLRWLPGTESAAAKQLDRFFGGLIVILVLLVVAAGWTARRRPRVANPSTSIAAPAEPADDDTRTDD